MLPCWHALIALNLPLLGQKRQSGNSVHTDLCEGRLWPRQGCGQFAFKQADRVAIVKVPAPAWNKLYRQSLGR